MIDVSTDVPFITSKKLVQSKISAYFKGFKGIPQENSEKKIQKRRMNGNRRKFGVTQSPRTPRKRESSVSSEVSSVSSSCAKRKLVAQIFSEDEDSDSENDCNMRNSLLQNKENSPTTPKKSTIWISLNKPSPLKKSPEKILIDWRPRCTSTPAVMSSGEILSTNSSNMNSTLSTNVQTVQTKELVAELTKDKLPINYSDSDSDDSDINANRIINTRIFKSATPKNNFENKNTDPCCSKTLTNNHVTRSATASKNLGKLKENSNTTENIKNVTSQKTVPCSSKTVTNTNQSQNKKKKENSNKSDENSNIPKKLKIKILNDVLIKPPPKDIPKKNKSLSKLVPMKDEDKKLNFNYLDVMKDFFFNVVNTINLKCLLRNDDREMLEKFFNTDRNYQYTCVKLFMWKPIWYNIFKYIERIGLQMSDTEVVAMYNCLKNNAFVDTDYMVEDLFTLLDLLSLKDLREIQRSFKITHTVNSRDAIINRLIKNCRTQVTLTYAKSTEEVLRGQIERKLGFCVKLSKQFTDALSNIYLLNTFTNSALTKPQEYFRNASDAVFPNYKTENYYIFYTPEEFSRYASATNLRNTLDDAIEKKNNTRIYEICSCVYETLKKMDDGHSFDPSRGPHLEKFTARAQYISILSTGVKYVTSSAHNEAKIWLEFLLLQKYCNFKRGHWYYHLAMIYTAYLKQYETAAKLLITAFEKDKEYLSEVQIHELAYRGKILDRKTYNLPMLYHDKIAALSPPSCERDWPQNFIENRTVRTNEPGRKRKYVKECANGDVNYLTVEQTALDHYQMIGYPEGEHSEGSLVCASFCLLFWDIIYESYVRGTFVSKVQNAPLDMYTKYFYLNRENLIKTRLHNIRSGWSEQELKTFFFEKWDLHSHESSLCLIDSIAPDRERLFCVVMCIGRSILSQIFERLVKNYKVYHSGFPDLIVWNVALKKAKFVEVKGENDNLSIKQKLWINYLLDIGADVEVCHIHSTGSKKKIPKPKITKSDKC